MGERGTAISLVLVSLFLLASMSGFVFASSENWVEVTRFTDEGTNYPTDPFTIDYVEWRIIWEFDPCHWHFVDLNTLSITTYPLGEVESYVNQINEKPNGNLRGVELLTQSGIFYMKINGGLIDSYTVIVEQNIDSIPEFPSRIILPIFMTVTFLAIVLKKRLT